MLSVPTTILISDSPATILHAHTVPHKRVTCHDHPILNYFSTKTAKSKIYEVPYYVVSHILILLPHS